MSDASQALSGGASPLTGVRVLDLTHFVAGPWATMMLARLGAEVIKVEPPDGEIGRHSGGVYADGESAIFLGFNRGKKGISIDLKSEDGRSRFERLVASADVVVNNFRPDVIQRLGLDHSVLSRINPQVISFSLSAFGPTGPYRTKAANDPIIQALTGVMAETGGESGPLRLGVSLPDFAGALVTSVAIVSGLVLRDRIGRGVDLTSSLLDAELFAQSDGATGVLNQAAAWTKPLVRLGDRIAQRAYGCADGSWVVVAADDEDSARALLDLLGLGDFPGEAPSFSTVDEATTRLVRTRTSSEVLGELEAAAVPAAPVRMMSQVFGTGAGSDLVGEYLHPSAGVVRFCAIPGEVDLEPMSAPPMLGEHDDAFPVDRTG